MPILRFEDGVTVDHRLASCPICLAAVAVEFLEAHTGNHPLMPDVVPPEDPVGSAVPGKPGHWVGIDGASLSTISELNALHLDLGPAWTNGDYIEYGPEGKNSFWAGDKFRSGVAPASN